jgi:hypothetical protein
LPQLPATTPGDASAGFLSELLTLRTILHSLFYRLASGETPGPQTEARIAKTYGDKRDKDPTHLTTGVPYKMSDGAGMVVSVATSSSTA